MARAERLGLEPGAIEPQLGQDTKSSYWDRPGEGEVKHSIAISLKRIADALERFDATMANWSTRP